MSDILINELGSWTWTGSDHIWRYKKSHGIVYIEQVQSANISSSNYTDLFTLPLGFRPDQILYFIGVGTTNGSQFLIQINTDGKVKAARIVGGSEVILYAFVISFPADA